MNFENQSTFVEVMGNIIVACFLLTHNVLCTPRPEKVPLYFAPNFAKCWPIFKILQPTDLTVISNNVMIKYPTTPQTR